MTTVPKYSIIALDGPASVGKSATALHLVEMLPGFIWSDSGSFYRALATITNDGSGASLRRLTSHNGIPLIDGKLVSDEKLHDKTTSSNVSAVAALAHVRLYVNDLIREMARKQNVIILGRDIGIAVCPDAELKIYLDAPPLVRAMRAAGDKKRYLEVVPLPHVLAAILLRDHRDSTRKESPFRPAPDAIVINNEHPDVNAYMVALTIAELWRLKTAASKP